MKVKKDTACISSKKTQNVEDEMVTDQEMVTDEEKSLEYDKNEDVSNSNKSSKTNRENNRNTNEANVSTLMEAPPPVPSRQSLEKKVSIMNTFY